jgi:hypothetical protein
MLEEQLKGRVADSMCKCTHCRPEICGASSLLPCLLSGKLFIEKPTSSSPLKWQEE